MYTTAASKHYGRYDLAIQAMVSSTDLPDAPAYTRMFFSMDQNAIW